MSSYEERRQRIIDQVKASKGDISLGKSTSNLFRHRKHATERIDVRDFNHVLSIDEKSLTAEVEGMTTFEELVDATLAYGLLPTVVPELKSITIGGAVVGVGIESSSFKYGLVHETVEEMEILLGDGRIITCSRTKNKDLFFGFPNSYGTLGYVLKLKIKLVKAKKYVKITHQKFSDPKEYFAAIANVCGKRDGPISFVDGTIFGEHEMYVTTGEFVDEAPHVSDYTYMRIYYKSIKTKRVDYVTAKGYIWRWDTDWFWCSKNVYAQNPLVRLLATKWLLSSKVYQRVMRASRNPPLKWMTKKNSESIIQDVDIPIENAPKFLEFFFKTIPIRPIWMCPVKSYAAEVFDLYALDPKKLYINFGFWDMVKSDKEPGYYNKAVEQKVFALHGKKGLYSTSYYDKETFWKIYNKERYDAVKKKYDPTGRLKGLYEKTVRARS